MATIHWYNSAGVTELAYQELGTRDAEFSGVHIFDLVNLVFVSETIPVPSPGLPIGDTYESPAYVSLRQFLRHAAR